ncbi:MAG: Ig-like domain-containing protein [Flavobacteriaceae bacterium]|jgi:hypothetical protein|nr:Ig-like domain-containing protein [Flavobacteriaceae bacterium]
MRQNLFGKIAVVIMIIATIVMTAHSYDYDHNLTPASETGVIVSPATLELHVDDRQTLTAKVTPTDATNKTIIWSSSDPDVATVDPATGEVTAIATGTATITAATTNGKTGSCVLTVAPDVYVAGYDGLTPMLWKNGVVQDSTTHLGMHLGGMAHSVYVSGNDVYVAGNYDNAVLYKNGVKQTFPNADKGVAHSVFVSGTDVYVAGFNVSGSHKRVAVLWKNGVLQDLTDGTDYAYAHSVFVSGSDVYVAGEENYKPVLWKNGVKQALSTNVGEASSVFVSDDDVYVAGNYNNASYKSVAALWKNGVKQDFTDGTNYAGASSVFVSGSDVYVAGYEYPDVVLWKNGVKQILPATSRSFVKTSSGRGYADVTSIFVSGNDVYVTGVDNDKPVLWKNGVPQILTGGRNHPRANSVFVK